MSVRYLSVQRAAMTFVLPVGVLLSLAVSLQAQQIFPDTIWVPVTFYDFHADGTNPEFEQYHNGGLYTGMVANALDAQKKPVRSSTLSNLFFNYYMEKWFRPWAPGDYTAPEYTTDGTGQYVRTVTLPHDTSFKNIVIQDSLPFRHIGNGLYQYENDAFFMLDNRGFGNEPSGDHNYSFTMELHSTFTYQPNLTFQFQGDDDVWGFIDNQLALDIGGIHSSLDGSIDLNSLTGLVPGRKYDFDFFYCERHTVASVIRITTNLFTPASYLRLYPESGPPDVGTNNPLGPLDTVKAGDIVTVYAHVFDTAYNWLPENDSLVTWQLYDDQGQLILTDTSGATNSFRPTEAGGRVTITATFQDPNDPSAPPTVATVTFYVGPGDPHHVDIISSSQVANLVDDENLRQITLDQNRDRDTVYAVVRDSMGNFVRFATAAQWSSQNTGIVTAFGTTGKLQEGNIVKQGGGTTQIIVSEGSLIPDTLTVTMESMAVSLRQAVTRDTDGDGYLDRIECTFDSAVTLSGQPSGVQVLYGNTTFTVDSVAGVSGNTSTVFVLYLAENHTAELQTGWLPELGWSSFGSATSVSGFICVDGAPPVINRALFYPAPLPGAGGTGAPDTLRVSLSEEVMWDQGATPEQVFIYYDDGTQNSGAFTGIPAGDMTTSSSEAVVYITNSLEIEPIKDSLRLTPATTRLVDLANNSPSSNNRKVPIEWGVDNSIELVPINNPFVAGRDRLSGSVTSYYGNVIASSDEGISSSTPGMIVGIQSLKPLKVRTDGTGAYGSAAVYDAVGNLVKSKVRVDKASLGTTDYGFFWDGRNENGRFVGRGTYLCIVNTEDVDGRKIVERIKIGVKR